jgi:predicted nucleic acid-binding protein
MTRLVLDAGAFVAFERGDAALRARLAAARRLGLELATTSPVIGQVWRDGRRQALLARLISATNVDAPTELDARRAGELLGKTRTQDIVDALLVGRVVDGDTVLTSDPRDIERLVATAGVRATVVTV